MTYAAHYPVGYPGARRRALRALRRQRPAAAMVLNALLGALAALAVHRARRALRRAPPAAPRSPALLVALHPALVAYTPALMTEGVTAVAARVCAVWAAAWARDAARATRVAGRPRRGARRCSLGAADAASARRCSLLAPVVRRARVVGAARGARRALVGGAARRDRRSRSRCARRGPRATASRMGRCALVSVNGGWNLLIGADAASNGRWSPSRCRSACREVWDEAEKDACFAREARRLIAAHPGAGSRLVAAQARRDLRLLRRRRLVPARVEPRGASASGAKVALGARRDAATSAWCSCSRWRGLARLAGGDRSGGAARGRGVALGTAVLVARSSGASAALTIHAWVGYRRPGRLARSRAALAVRGPGAAGAAVAALGRDHGHPRGVLRRRAATRWSSSRCWLASPRSACGADAPVPVAVPARRGRARRCPCRP